jgi:hypothetical protein
VASENKIKTKMSLKKYFGVYCCVVGCNSAYPGNKEKAQIFCFSKKIYSKGNCGLKLLVA